VGRGQESSGSEEPARHEEGRLASLVVVELAAGKPLKRPVTLKEIKADQRFAAMPLVRIVRLSVQPVTDEEWDLIETISKFV